MVEKHLEEYLKEPANLVLQNIAFLFCPIKKRKLFTEE